MGKNKKINLVLTSDENYIKLLVPCIISVLNNKKEDTEIDIYILETGINEYHKRKIKELETFKGTTNCKIEFLDAEKVCSSLVKQNYNYFYWTTAILYRLAIPKIFKHLDRVLYTDIDTIIRGDLLEIYNQDFEDNYCCLSREIPLICTSKIYENDVIINENYKLSGGTILFNIKKIIKDNKQDELVDVESKFPKGLPKLLDQDMIGDTFKSKIKGIEYLLECLVENADMIKKKGKKDNKEYLSNIKNASILHYAYSIKPFRLDKLEKLDRYGYKIFYAYYQQSYLRINPIKLKIIFLLSDIKRLRRYISGIKKEQNGRKVFYFFNIEVVLNKGE